MRVGSAHILLVCMCAHYARRMGINGADVGDEGCL